MTELLKWLTHREHELENKRTRSLARQQWADVIECDARIDECAKTRAKISLIAQKPQAIDPYVIPPTPAEKPI